MRFMADTTDDYEAAWQKFKDIVKEYLGKEARLADSLPKIPAMSQISFDYGRDGDTVTVVNWDHFGAVLNHLASEKFVEEEEKK